MALKGGCCSRVCSFVSAERNTVENLNVDIRTQGNGIRKSLKAMESETESLEDKTPGQMTAELRIRKTQQSTLSRKFIDVMTEYNKAQNEYREGCKHRIKHQLAAVGKETDNNELEELIRSDNPDVFHQQVVIDDRAARKALTEVELRHKEIIKLERCLQELHELFLDMARLVEQQGETIDRIETNVEQSTKIVAKAKDETKKAVKYKKAARKKKIIIGCVIAGVIVLIIVLIVVNVS